MLRAADRYAYSDCGSTLDYLEERGNPYTCSVRSALQATIGRLAKGPSPRPAHPVGDALVRITADRGLFATNRSLEPSFQNLRRLQLDHCVKNRIYYRWNRNPKERGFFLLFFVGFNYNSVYLKLVQAGLPSCGKGFKLATKKREQGKGGGGETYQGKCHRQFRLIVRLCFLLLYPSRSGGSGDERFSSSQR